MEIHGTIVYLHGKWHGWFGLLWHKCKERSHHKNESHGYWIYKFIYALFTGVLFCVRFCVTVLFVLSMHAFVRCLFFLQKNILGLRYAPLPPPPDLAYIAFLFWWKKMEQSYSYRIRVCYILPLNMTIKQINQVTWIQSRSCGFW